MIVLGLHGGVTLGQHEPSAALVINGKVAAICEEERYLRIKSAYGYLPYYSILACLKMANIKWEDIDLIVTPGVTYPDFGERIKNYLEHCFGSCPKVERIHHQMAHLSSAFYASGYEESLVLSLDATGDGACSMAALATREGGIKVFHEIPTNQSIGFFYTLMTYYLGFGDGDEYKVMGLAPYGETSVDLSSIIKPTQEGWSFDWSCVRSEPFPKSPFEPLYASKIENILNHPHRKPKDQMHQFYKDVARSTQAVFEECVLNYMKGIQKKAAPFKGVRNLCYAGGTALNCSANKNLITSGIFDHVYVSPVSSDRGLALGCAYYGAVSLGDKPWQLPSPYFGSSYSNDDILKELEGNGVKFKIVDDPAGEGAKLLNEGKILGWYQGRSEAGARALGNRSILAKCESKEMRDTVNARIKYREEFRPFAPSILYEESHKYFDSQNLDFPYMCFTVDAREEKIHEMEAVVHVDKTARVQTVKSSNNEIYYDLIKKYQKISGSPIILNTSYNLKGQPIVETPRDALMTFFGCGLDSLIMGNFVIKKDI